MRKFASAPVVSCNSSSFSLGFPLALLRFLSARYGVSFTIPAAFSWRKRHAGTTIGRGITSVGEGGRQGSSPPGDSAPPSFCALQSRGFPIADGVLPRAPLPQDPSSRDEHLSAPVTSLTACSFSRSLLLFSRGHSVSTRGTPLRAREWRLSRLARPFQRAGAIPSFLPASLLACLPVCPPSSISPSLFHPFHPLSRTYSNFACSPQADNCRRACARCHPDCLIVS